MRISSRVWMAVVAVTGALGAGAAQAHGDDVQWQVSVGTPVPGVVVQRPVPVVVEAPRHVPRYHAHDRRDPHDRYDDRRHARHDAPRHARWGYQQPTRWDRDGDRIPDRHDRVYNPAWDRDGDRIPNRHDRTPDGWGGRHGR